MTWKMTIVFTVFGADMSYYADLNFRTQTVPTRFYTLHNETLSSDIRMLPSK